MTLDKLTVERAKHLLAIWDAAPLGEITKEEHDAHAELRNMGPQLARIIAALVPQEEEVGRMVERLRDAKPLGPGNVGVSGKTANDAADLFERLVGIQGK